MAVFVELSLHYLAVVVKPLDADSAVGRNEFAVVQTLSSRV